MAKKKNRKVTKKPAKKARAVLTIAKSTKKKPAPKKTISALLRKKKASKAVAPKKKIIRKKAKRPTPARKPKPAPRPSSEFPADSLFKAKIKVVGIGGGGGSIVSEIGRSLEKASFVVADTDIRALKKKAGIKYFWFGENMTRGLGTGVNPELAKKAAEESKEKISNLFKDQDIIIFIASLGGGLGSGATQVFAEAAKEFGGITFGIFTLPFKFEGKNKQKIANDSLKKLRSLLNVSLTIPNERIFKLIDANTPITDAFSLVNKSLIESLESLIDLIYNPGVINIDFADLRTILKGRGNVAFLNTVEESGKERAEETCKKILVNPLYQNTGFAAQKILYNIAGAENLSMFEVEKISRGIADLNPKAKIIFGISKNLKLKNKIKTTILMTGGGAKTESVKEPVLEKEKVELVVKASEKLEAPKPKIAPKQKSQKKKVAASAPLRRSSSEASKASAAKAKKPEKKPAVPFDKIIPVFKPPAREPVKVVEKKLAVAEMLPDAPAKAMRRSALDIKKAQELEEQKKAMQEKEWEIPAFLRKVKFKS